MKFICGACKTKYTISDEKVRGKVLKVKCKKCEAVVEVREAGAGAEVVARVVAGFDSGPGHAPHSSTGQRPRVSTGTELRKGSGGGPAFTGGLAPGAASAPRPRTATGPVPTGQPRGRTGTAPPPTPPDALRPGPQGPAGRPGARPVAKGSTGPGIPAVRGPGETKSSGVRPAARPGGFLASGSGGASGGLASSLAEALSASVAPPPAQLEPELATSISPFVDDLVAKALPKEWWVAVRDTPTGPMTRDQVEEHIKAGDADAESLVWREGQDDWRPLREVHALSEILRGTGRAQLPKAPPGRTPLRSSVTPLPVAPDRSVGSVATPIAGLKGAVAVPAPTGSTGGGMFPHSTGLPAASGRGSLQIPIEDVLGAPPSVVGGPLAAIAPVPRMPMVTDDSVAAPVPSKKMSPLAWVAVCGALAFGITLALGLLNYLGPRLATRPTGPTERVRVVTVGGAAPPDLAPPTAPGEPGGQEGSSAQEGGDQRSGGSRSGAGGNAAASKTKGLSAEDQALLARFQQENGIAASNLQIKRAQSAGGSGASALTSDQVRAVVSRERSSVQSCYERAMRGRSQAEDVRVTVVANVGASGAVTSVSVRGGNDASMVQCIQSAVRRWRFPAAAGASQPEIPFLFTAHATH